MKTYKKKQKFDPFNWNEAVKVIGLLAKAYILWKIGG